MKGAALALVTLRAGLVAGLAAGPAGCGEPKKSPAEARKQAEQVWQLRCTTCHGVDGDGNGPQARHLAVKPRALRDPSWQASVSDEHLRTVIVEGGQAVGKSPVMAANPDLRKHPEVVDALVQIVRGL